jgi:putative ABC transport system substrate-binding protein
VKRREFIAGLGGAAAWPWQCTAQQSERVRRIGVLMSIAKDSNTEPRITTLQQELRKLGWISGRNIQIDVRWAAGDPDRIRNYASELVALPSDVIVANGSAPTEALRRASQSVPVVFVLVTDPVAEGFVESLARPGGNITGFKQSEYSISGKWLELLKQIAPQVSRVAVLRDPSAPAGTGQFGAIQTAAQPLGVDVRPLDVRDVAVIERGIAEFSRTPNGGLIVVTGPLVVLHRELIISLAARYQLPIISPYRFYVTAGGLISYGTDAIDHYRQVAVYVDRILRGEKAADLPVQHPMKFELVLNRKTAKALGLQIPDTLLARADEVIE